MNSRLPGGASFQLAVAVMVCLLAVRSAGSPTCAATPAGSVSAAPVADPGASPRASLRYRISPGDVVSILVRGETDLSRDCQVNGEGTISYPLLGDLPAAGLTCGELAGRLQQALRRYLRRPEVAAVIRQYGALGTNVFVTGEVHTPGLYPLAGGTGLVQALAAAGGPTKQASAKITILKAHTGEVHVTGLDQAVPGAVPDPQAALDPGDVIVVSRKPEADQDRRYTVLGEVPTPGMFEIPEDREVRVLDAMEKAGLLSARPASQTGPVPALAAEQSHADLEHARLSRSQVVVSLNLRALLQGDVSQNLLLQPGDVVTVPRRPVATVYALGEVHAPGRQMVDLGSTVLDLLNVAGGVTSGARLSDATLLRVAVGGGGLVASGAERRVVEGTPTSTRLDLAKLLRTADPRENTVLQEGDVLFVPARGQPGRDIWTFLPLLPYVTR